jgi:hypothetical protein
VNTIVPVDTLCSPKLSQSSYNFVKKWISRVHDCMSLYTKTDTHLSSICVLSEQIHILREYHVLSSGGDLEVLLKQKQLRKMNTFVQKLQDLHSYTD